MYVSYIQQIMANLAGHLCRRFNQALRWLMRLCGLVTVGLNHIKIGQSSFQMSQESYLAGNINYNLLPLIAK